MAEIERKINQNEYDLNESDSEKSQVIKDKDDLFFATEIETNYVAQEPVIVEATSALENI